MSAFTASHNKFLEMYTWPQSAESSESPLATTSLSLDQNNHPNLSTLQSNFPPKNGSFVSLPSIYSNQSPSFLEMASIAIHSAGNLLRTSFLPTNKPPQITCTNPLLPKKISHNFPSASIAPSHQTIFPTHNRDEQLTELPSDLRTKREDLPGRIDSWLQDSVADIVKNLKQAPLLVQIYSEFDGVVKIQMEKVVFEEWSVVKDKWRSGESKSPDGLIFVEELERESGRNRETGEGVTRAWGIVVQGKGVECGPACYLLKTDRVCAGLGLGFCTHFCLMRVNNFRDTALEQFQNSWLLQ